MDKSETSNILNFRSHRWHCVLVCVSVWVYVHLSHVPNIYDWAGEWMHVRIQSMGYCSTLCACACARHIYIKMCVSVWVLSGRSTNTKKVNDIPPKAQTHTRTHNWNQVCKKEKHASLKACRRDWKREKKKGSKWISLSTQTHTHAKNETKRKQIYSSRFAREKENEQSCIALGGEGRSRASVFLFLFYSIFCSD